MGRLLVPVGVVDRPFEQRRDPFVVDLSGAGGHVAIVGGPQTGKSTLLRSLICALALTHTPAEVQFYCLDFGGGRCAAWSSCRTSPASPAGGTPRRCAGPWPR